MAILFFKRRFPAARIIGFEPERETFQTLQQNLQRNAIDDVSVHCCALTDADGVVPLYRGEKGKGSLVMSIIPERMPGERIEVEARRLSPLH